MILIKKSENFKEFDLDIKSYIICYKKPISLQDIAKKLWGDNWKERKSTLSKNNGPLRKLKNKGYLVYCPRPDNVTTNALYCLSTPKYILDEINKSVKLSESESTKLYQILDSDEFRSFIIYDNFCNNIGPIIEFISTLSNQLIFFSDLHKHFKIKKNLTLENMFNDLINDNEIKQYPIIKIKNENKLYKNSEIINTKLSKLKRSTLNKLTQLNKYYFIRNVSLLGSFLIGRNTK